LVLYDSSASLEPPGLRVRRFGRLTVVELVNAEVLIEPDMIENLSRHLNRLVEEGHSRLLLNFGGVRSMSCHVLGVLASLYRKIQRQGGRLVLYGLEPLFRDMLRICRLDGLFEIYTDEAEAVEKALAQGRRLKRK
jgi:anti-sigma B factor antagonist